MKEAVRDAVKNGRTALPDDPKIQAFLVEAAIRRAWPSITREEFAALSDEEVDWHLAYLEGEAEGQPRPQT